MCIYIYLYHTNHLFILLRWINKYIYIDTANVKHIKHYCYYWTCIFQNYFYLYSIYIPIVVIVVSVVANFILIIISHKSIYTIRSSISGCVYWNRKCRISLHFPGCTSIISLFLPTCILHWSSACPMNGQVVAAAHLKYRIPNGI